MENLLENLSKSTQVEKQYVYSLITMKEIDGLVKKSSDMHKKARTPIVL